AGGFQAVLLQGPQACRRRQAASGPGPAGAAQLRAGSGRRLSRDRVGAAFRHADRFHHAGPPRRRAGIRQPGVWLLPWLPDLLPARKARSGPSMSPQLWALAVAGVIVLGVA